MRWTLPKIIIRLFLCLPLFAGCLSHAQVVSPLTPFIPEAQNYLDDPLLIKPFLQNIITPNGAFSYNYPQTLHQALNDLLHIYPKNFLVGFENFNGFTNQVIQSNPSLLRAYKSSLQLFPPSITQSTGIMNWLNFKQAYVTKTKFFTLPQYGNLIALISCEDSTCRNILTAAYNPSNNNLIGYITVQANPTQTYIFGAKNQADLSLLLMLNALSVNPIVINSFYSFAPVTSNGI